MSIVQNFWLKNQKKKLGGSVIYQAMGETRARVLAAEVKNPRTVAQMQQRIRWANLVNIYRANKRWMKYAFETKATNQSDYNKFMSLNVSASPIFLTKELASVGACVVAPYVVTQGSLPSIEFIKKSFSWQTNILLPSGYLMYQNVTVGDFSRILLENNPGMREGDQLSFIRETQMTNPTTGAPYIIVRAYEMLLNSSSSALAADFLPFDILDSSEASSDCRLVVKDTNNAGAFTMILSRSEGGRTYVSSQYLILANMDFIYLQYSSQAAYQAALLSYGAGENAFLSANSAEEYDNTAPSLAITALKIGNNEYTPGGSYILNLAPGSYDVEVVFNANVPTVGMGSIDGARIFYGRNGSNHIINFTEDARLSENKVIGTFTVTAGAGIEDQDLIGVSVGIDNATYSTGFTVRANNYSPVLE